MLACASVSRQCWKCMPYFDVHMFASVCAGAVMGCGVAYLCTAAILAAVAGPAHRTCVSWALSMGGTLHSIVCNSHRQVV
jgi:hypothetical protein